MALGTLRGNHSIGKISPGGAHYRSFEHPRDAHGHWIGTPGLPRPFQHVPHLHLQNEINNATSERAKISNSFKEATNAGHHSAPRQAVRLTRQDRYIEELLKEVEHRRQPGNQGRLEPLPQAPGHALQPRAITTDTERLDLVDQVNGWWDNLDAPSRARLGSHRAMMDYALDEPLDTSELYTVHDEHGNLGGIMSISTMPALSAVEVDFVGSTQNVKGTGSALMRKAAARAHEEGFALRLMSLPEAKPFYEKLGLHNVQGGSIYLLYPEEAGPFSRGQALPTHNDMLISENAYGVSLTHIGIVHDSEDARLQLQDALERAQLLLEDPNMRLRNNEALTVTTDGQSDQFYRDLGFTDHGDHFSLAPNQVQELADNLDHIAALNTHLEASLDLPSGPRKDLTIEEIKQQKAEALASAGKLSPPLPQNRYSESLRKGERISYQLLDRSSIDAATGDFISSERLFGAPEAHAPELPPGFETHPGDFSLTDLQPTQGYLDRKKVNAMLNDPAHPGWSDGMVVHERNGVPYLVQGHEQAAARLARGETRGQGETHSSASELHIGQFFGRPRRNIPLSDSPRVQPEPRPKEPAAPKEPDVPLGQAQFDANYQVHWAEEQRKVEEDAANFDVQLANEDMQRYLQNSLNSSQGLTESRNRMADLQAKHDATDNPETRLRIASDMVRERMRQDDLEIAHENNTRHLQEAADAVKAAEKDREARLQAADDRIKAAQDVLDKIDKRATNPKASTTKLGSTHQKMLDLQQEVDDLAYTIDDNRRELKSLEDQKTSLHDDLVYYSSAGQVISMDPSYRQQMRDDIRAQIQDLNDELEGLKTDNAATEKKWESKNRQLKLTKDKLHQLLNDKPQGARSREANLLAAGEKSRERRRQRIEPDSVQSVEPKIDQSKLDAELAKDTPSAPTVVRRDGENWITENPEAAAAQSIKDGHITADVIDESPQTPDNPYQLEAPFQQLPDQPLTFTKESSAIKSASYNPETQDLSIEFPGNRHYVYHQVPQDVVDQLQAADSPGAFVSSDIRKQFNYTQVDAPEDWTPVTDHHAVARFTGQGIPEGPSVPWNQKVIREGQMTPLAAGLISDIGQVHGAPANMEPIHFHEMSQQELDALVADAGIQKWHVGRFAGIFFEDPKTGKLHVAFSSEIDPDQKQATILHENGHALDVGDLGTPHGRLTSETSAFDSFWQAYSETSLHGTRPAMDAGNVSKEEDYNNMKGEIWADMYAFWMAKKTNNQAALRAFQKQDPTGTLFPWSEEDFAKLDPQITAIIGHLNADHPDLQNPRAKPDAVPTPAVPAQRKRGQRRNIPLSGRPANEDLSTLNDVELMRLERAAKLQKIAKDATPEQKANAEADLANIKAERDRRRAGAAPVHLPSGQFSGEVKVDFTVPKANPLSPAEEKRLSEVEKILEDVRLGKRNDLSPAEVDALKAEKGQLWGRRGFKTFGRPLPTTIHEDWGGFTDPTVRQEWMDRYAGNERNFQLDLAKIEGIDPSTLSDVQSLPHHLNDMAQYESLSYPAANHNVNYHFNETNYGPSLNDLVRGQTESGQPPTPYFNDPQREDMFFYTVKTDAALSVSERSQMYGAWERAKTREAALIDETKGRDVTLEPVGNRSRLSPFAAPSTPFERYLKSRGRLSAGQRIGLKAEIERLQRGDGTLEELLFLPQLQELLD